jgi:sugar/nucleoside kinase (ribokinase family)
MNTFLGASVELGEDELDQTKIEGARLTYLEGYLFDPPLAQAAFHEAARIAAEAGRQVALSLSDAFCVERHRAAFRSLIQGGVDLLFANEEEICMLYEVEDFDKAAEAVRSECRLAALTRSAKGSVIVTPDEQIMVEAAPVDKVVDVTGAGDLYAAGFLYGRAVGCDLKTCGELASLAAAEVISHLGARPETSLNALAKARGLIR